MEVEATTEHPAEHRLGHFGEEVRIHDKPVRKFEVYVIVKILFVWWKLLTWYHRRRA